MITWNDLLCSSLVDHIQTLQKQNKKLMLEVEEKRSEFEKYKSLQSHSNLQQILINKLKAKLDDYEYDSLLHDIWLVCLLNQ